MGLALLHFIPSWPTWRPMNWHLQFKVILVPFRQMVCDPLLSSDKTLCCPLFSFSLKIVTHILSSLCFLMTVHFFFFVFLGPHTLHREVPRLGIKLEPRGIQAMSATYTTAHGNARSLTHWVRPGIEIKIPSSRITAVFVTAVPWWEHLMTVHFYILL